MAPHISHLSRRSQSWVTLNDFMVKIDLISRKISTCDLGYIQVCGRRIGYIELS